MTTVLRHFAWQPCLVMLLNEAALRVAAAIAAALRFEMHACGASARNGTNVLEHACSLPE
jgi:hypothetical protein